MDDSIEPTGGDDNDDLPVEIGTLEIEGERPEVGDMVNLRVKGSVTKIVDKIAWVKPETINDLPMPEGADASEEKLMESARAHDSMMGMSGMEM